MSIESIKPRMLLHLALKLNFITKQQVRDLLKSSVDVEKQLLSLLDERCFYKVRQLFILKSILKIAEKKNFISRIEYIYLLDCQLSTIRKNSDGLATALGEKLSISAVKSILTFLSKSSIISKADEEFMSGVYSRTFSTVESLSKPLDEINLDHEETISILRSSSPVPVAPKKKEFILKEYNIVKKTSENSCLALDEKNQACTIQFFTNDISMELIHKFYDKMQILKGVRHKNIVTAYDFGFYPTYDQYSLVKEYVEGISVKEMTQKHGKLPIALALKITYHVLNALRHAQTHNIIHGNIRPDNIIITKDNKSAKLGGFCLDRIVSELEMKAQENDTYFYMSLEQIQFPDLIDHRSDIYNLGATLYFMICGREPYFECRNMYEIATAYMQSRKPALLTKTPNEVVQVVNKAMAIDKTQRYETLLAMQSDIERLLK